jgi:hypothetical protein
VNNSLGEKGVWWDEQRSSPLIEFSISRFGDGTFCFQAERFTARPKWTGWKKMSQEME